MPDASSETSVSTNSQLIILIKTNSARNAIHIPSNDEDAITKKTVG